MLILTYNIIGITATEKQVCEDREFLLVFKNQTLKRNYKLHLN